MRSTKKRTQNRIWVFLLALAALLVCACLLLHRLGAAPPALYEALSGGTGTESAPFDESGIPAYGGQDWVELNKNRPLFTKEELSAGAHVTFSPFDSLGRTGTGEAMLGPELLPTEERGPVGDFRPSGWHTARYDDLIEDRFLYNRCHVVGYLLCGDNSTPENLFTGTRYLNATSMLEWEMKVAYYIHSTKNHVAYRVIPTYEGKNLVASGVRMEAYSVEDHGKGLQFHVFVYNIQPGVVIDYRTGDSSRAAG